MKLNIFSHLFPISFLSSGNSYLFNFTYFFLICFFFLIFRSYLHILNINILQIICVANISMVYLSNTFVVLFNDINFNYIK